MTGSEPELDLLADMRNAAWLDAQEFPPLRYAVPGIIPEGSTMFAGPPKVGKSWFLLGAALGLAYGGRALGSIAVEQRPVFYLALEDGDRRLQERCRELVGTEPLPAALDYLTSVRPGLVIPTIARWLEIHGDGVVMLDTLGKVMPAALPGETTYQRDYRIGSALKRLADDHPGCSVIVNHHVRKAASDDFVDSISGTNGLAGAADTIIAVTRSRYEADGLVKVTGRDVLEEEYAVTFKDGHWTLGAATLAESARLAAKARTTAGVGDRMAEVIAMVTDAGRPTRPAEVALKLAMSADDAGKYLRRAADKGRLLRVGRGQYIPTLSEVSEVSEVLPFGHSDTSDTMRYCTVCEYQLAADEDPTVTTHPLCEPS